MRCDREFSRWWTMIILACGGNMLYSGSAATEVRAGAISR